MEQVGAVGDVVRGRGMTLGATEQHDGSLLQIACALDRRHDHRGRAVGLEAAIEEAERFRHPRRREVVVHRQLAAAHHGLLVEVRVLAAGERDRPGVGRQRAVELLMTGRDPAVELRGGARAVRKVEVDERVGDCGTVDALAGPTGAGAGAERRVAVPTDDDEHRVGDARGHRGRGVHDARAGARAAHVRGRRVTHVGHAEVRGELFDRRVTGRRHDPVDVGGRQPRVGDRVGRGREHELDRQSIRRPFVRGLGDARDRDRAREAACHGGADYGINARATVDAWNWLASP